MNPGSESDPELALDIAGVCGGARWVPSPHWDARPDEMRVELIVIHNISLPPGEFGGPWIDDLFLGKLDAEAHAYFREIAEMKVSSHFLIRRDGELIQYVPTELRAWHAGQSSWKGRERCNDFSVGIELEGSDDQPFENAQYETLAKVTRALYARYGEIDLAGHSDIAPDRKTDPGPCFDWARYRGLAG